MKFLSLSLLSVSALSTLVSAGPLTATIDQLRIFRSSEPELRLVQYRQDIPNVPPPPSLFWEERKKTNKKCFLISF